MLVIKEKARLERNLGGIRNMYKLPEAIFVTDTITNKIAVEEAVKLGIKIIAICDSNSNPDNIDYIIPGNDDATKSITLITKKIAEAINEGQSVKPVIDKKEIVVEETISLDENKTENVIEKNKE